MNRKLKFWKSDITGKLYLCDKDSSEEKFINTSNPKYGWTPLPENEYPYTGVFLDEKGNFFIGDKEIFPIKDTQYHL